MTSLSPKRHANVLISIEQVGNRRSAKTVIPALPDCLPAFVEIVHHQNDRHKIVSRQAYLRGAKSRFRHWQLAEPGCSGLYAEHRSGPSLPLPAITFLSHL